MVLTKLVLFWDHNDIANSPASIIMRCTIASELTCMLLVGRNSGWANSSQVASQFCTHQSSMYNDSFVNYQHAAILESVCRSQNPCSLKSASSMAFVPIRIVYTWLQFVWKANIGFAMGKMKLGGNKQDQIDQPRHAALPLTTMSRQRLWWK